MARRFAGFFGFRVFPRLPNQGAKLLHIGIGKRIHPLSERVIIGDQTVAPLFGGVQKLRFAGGWRVLFDQRRANRLQRIRVQQAHLFADKLHQTATRFKAGNALIFR